jgi:hypothetical protein
MFAKPHSDHRKNLSVEFDSPNALRPLSATRATPARFQRLAARPKCSSDVLLTPNCSIVFHSNIAAHFGAMQKSRRRLIARTSSTLRVSPKPLSRASEVAGPFRTSANKCTSEIGVLPCRKRYEKRCIPPRKTSTRTPQVVSEVLWKSRGNRSATAVSRESSSLKQLRSWQVDAHGKSIFSKRRKTHERL